jgi:hypothetical protein
MATVVGVPLSNKLIVTKAALLRRTVARHKLLPSSDPRYLDQTNRDERRPGSFSNDIRELLPKETTYALAGKLKL